MAVVYLGLGSNLNSQANLQLAVGQLKKRFTLRKVSPVYRNKPVGFDGNEFLNAVACIETDLDPQAVCNELEMIHDLAGRIRGEKRFESRTLDIDLLLYDNLVISSRSVSVPRADVLKYSFVLRPLVDLDPDLHHPQTGKTMLQHWREFDVASHPLHEVPGIL